MKERPQGVDGKLGRIIALIVIVVCVAILGFVNRSKFFGAVDADTIASNPELMACLEERVGAVDKMRSDEVINEAQYDLFLSRAEAYCEARFGEHESPQSDPY